MKREILFRAWDKDIKTMIYPEEKENNKTSEYIINAWCDSENERTILMQFTGLIDKNGVKIFEGDVLYHKPYDIPRTVIYNEASFSLKSEYDSPIVMCNENLRFLEVIGNIHDNPELLNK